MRRFMIFLLLVSLMGCSTPSTGDVENPNTPDVTDNTEETPGDIQEEHDTIIEKYGEEKLQEKFRTVLKESKYYDSIFDGNKAVLTVLADSIEIRREDQDIPMITITQDDEYSVTPKMHFTDTFEFDYIKDGITKDAKLIIAYYANDNDHEERIIYCDLYVNNGNDHYSFFYNLNWNTVYVYTDSLKEELFFTDDLHQKILNYCKEKNLVYYDRWLNIQTLVEELYKSTGERIASTSQYYAEVHDYKRFNKNVLFGKDIADAVFPLIQENEETIVETLYVAVKDDVMGVINADGTLGIPYQCASLPHANEGDGGGLKHVHCYLISDAYAVFNRYIGNITNGTHKYCPGGHGASIPYDYLFFEDSQELARIRFNEFNTISEIDLDILGNTLNIYESVKPCNDDADNCRTGYDTRKNPEGDGTYYPENNIKYIETGKYGVLYQGKKITEPIYDNGLALNSDLAAVQKNGLWGYVNAEGIEVIPCQY
ncbi:MAG: WG repeat-containing protein, partial [Erysipelotrichales bacterium]|nr:WG repeat-containing protein [Erysipelotrichales bacterium]